MRIALVAPLAEAVPPKLYGGTERVVSWLAEEFVRQGHDVTLFASGDSQTSAKLVPCAPHGLRLAGFRDHTASNLAMLKEVRKRVDQFDVIHFHIDLLQYPFFDDIAHKCVTTMHGRLDVPDFMPVYHAWPGMALVSISDHQRLPMPASANWLATIHHGLGAEICPFEPEPDDYVAFLGRISVEKRPDRAIEIAKRAGVKLKIAAKVDKADQDYYDEVIKPLLDHPLIEFIGEVNEQQKCGFLGKARGASLPDRLAGTVRVGHGGSHVGRHARHRLAQRVSSGNHRGWREWRHRGFDGRGGRRRRSRDGAAARRRPRRVRDAVHRRTHGAQLHLGLREAARPEGAERTGRGDRAPKSAFPARLNRGCPSPFRSTAIRRSSRIGSDSRSLIA